jgi:hypothetical protein
MSPRVPFLTIVSGLVTAAAWWVSRGVVDLVLVDGQTVRLAFLPGWVALLGFLVAAAALFGLVSVVLPASQHPTRPDLRWLPLWALAVLGLPYLPFVADALAPLRLLAGPLRSAVWVVVTGVTAWSLVAPSAAVRERFSRWHTMRPHGTTLLVAAVAAAALLTGRSLDGVVAPGLSDIGLRLALFTATTWATVTSATRATRDGGAAALATVGLLLSVPALQTVATGGRAVTVMSLVAVVAVGRAPLLTGLACGLLTWVGTDTVPLAVILLLGRLAIASMTAASRTPDLTTLASLVVPFLAAVLIRASGLFAVPASWAAEAAVPVTGGSASMTSGLLGLLFDQRHGLLVWIPAAWLALSGVRVLWARGLVERAEVVTTGLAGVFVLAGSASQSAWWGDERAHLWPLAVLLPLLAPVVAAGWRAAPPLSSQRAISYVLLWLGLWMSATMLWSDAAAASLRGLPGLSPLLIWMSPLNEVWMTVPTFRHDSVTTALVHTLAWVAAAASGWIVLGRLRPRSPAICASLALVTTGITVVIAATLVTLWPHDVSLAGPPPLARSRRLSLEHFDPRARPAALLYTPLTRLAADAALPLLGLQVTPGLRTDPQPLRVLLNGRWSLPAGHYRLTVEWTPGALVSPESAGLQVGRTGPPLTTLEVGGDGGRAALEFTLPTDAVFVGLRGSTALERALTRLSVTPLSVTPAALRPAMPQVVGATQTPGGLVLVHTDTAGIEAERGVWIMAGAPAELSLAEPTSGAPVGASSTQVVRLRSEAPDNRITLASLGWTQTVMLSPGVPLDVRVPRTGTLVTPLTLTAASAYIPAEHVPGSDDRRPLGVWVTRPAPEDTAVH